MADPQEIIDAVFTDESRRQARASGAYSNALELFQGDPERTTEWLSTPLQALANAAPLTLAATDIGAREVEELIGQLQHGIII